MLRRADDQNGRAAAVDTIVNRDRRAKHRTLSVIFRHYQRTLSVVVSLLIEKGGAGEGAPRARRAGFGRAHEYNVRSDGERCAKPKARRYWKRAIALAWSELGELYAGDDVKDVCGAVRTEAEWSATRADNDASSVHCRRGAKELLGRRVRCGELERKAWRRIRMQHEENKSRSLVV